VCVQKCNFHIFCDPRLEIKVIYEPYNMLALNALFVVNKNKGSATLDQTSFRHIDAAENKDIVSALNI